MNKLQMFTQRLREAGLSERQIDEAVLALNEYNNTFFSEIWDAYREDEVDNHHDKPAE